MSSKTVLPVLSQIHSQMLQILRSLTLPKVYFSGKVVINFSRLKNLVWLNLGKNNLGLGTTNDLDFITSLTNCTRLDLLALYVNQFGGVLPHSTANLSITITAIEMRQNQILGTIPSGIGNLVNLNTFTMEFNQLSGIIPQVIGELKYLQVIYIPGCKLVTRYHSLLSG